MDGAIEGTERLRPGGSPTDGTGRIAAPRISVRVRTAAARDAEILVTLRRQAEAAHARLLPDYFRVSPATKTAPASASPGAGTVTLVAERDDGPGGVLGYVTVKLVETPRDPAMTPRRRAHVDSIVVDEDHRGRGVGTALMQAAGQWARRRGAAELVLTVWSDNRPAEALYRRLGYEPLARIMHLPLDR